MNAIEIGHYMVVNYFRKIATRTEAGGALHEIKTRLLNIVVGIKGCTFLNAKDDQYQSA
ncbi:MAG: hypothetical protein VX597_00815 [Pseudomonadota bacterium]|nr:hypothetical protein [Pseudomonadota bacterium]